DTLVSCYLLSSFFFLIRRPPTSPLFPYTTLFRSGAAEGLHERLLGGEAPGERAQRQRAFALGEQALPQPRGAGDGPLEPGQIDHVDTQSDDHAHSTVTDFARLRGWSTSRPFAVASSMPKMCSGTTESSGSKNGSESGTRTTSSANGTTATSPSSAIAITRAPRARISWMFETTFLCSDFGSRGLGTTTNTIWPGSMSAIGPCLSSPAAKPSAWM